MTTVITSDTHPVQKRWLLKNVLVTVPVLIIFGLINPLFFVIILIASVTNVIIPALRLANFSYALDEKFLTIRQGIFRREERHIPYSVIQEITIQAGVMDRILGLTSISIMNASQSGGFTDEYGNSTSMWHGMRVTTRSRSKMEMIGFKGNMVHIPGMLPAHADELKAALLKKMKEHEGEDTGSGL